MVQFTVNKNLCNLIYKTKNIILDSHFNSLNTEEKSRFISLTNNASIFSGKDWDIISISSSNVINKKRYNFFSLQRDTLPLNESITVLGKGSPLIGVIEQPNIKIDCSNTIQTIQNNPNIGQVGTGIQSLGQNPLSNN
jgi:hypothetical protein